MAHPLVTSGQFHVRRTGDFVTLFLEDVLLVAGSGSGHIVTLPGGFRGIMLVRSSRISGFVGLSNNALNIQAISVFGSAVWWNLGIGTGGISLVRPSRGLQGEVTFRTADPWPTVLPGTPG
ncbi:hypothetical protein [Pseudoclavibacter endophyticus]|uniref:hypothetical protein n=1 Tax=Pseudoclavibacter endophyticus TaxID=1778590 RepID=UPI00166543C6|nr:hypothetical protein [Pseudoclavibacter endophyticus]